PCAALARAPPTHLRQPPRSPAARNTAATPYPHTSAADPRSRCPNSRASDPERTWRADSALDPAPAAPPPDNPQEYPSRPEPSAHAQCPQPTSQVWVESCDQACPTGVSIHLTKLIRSRRAGGGVGGGGRWQGVG